MASQAISGIGAKFYRKDESSSGGLYVPLAEVSNIPGPTRSRSTIDVTSFDSEGGYKEFIGGLRDPGEFSLDMNFIDSTYGPLNDDFEGESLQSYRVGLANDVHTIFDFLGIVTALNLTVPLDDKVMQTVVIKVSGRIVKGYDTP